MTIGKLKISTPGRICLFGEHQDYLGLPVIASAISKRIYVEGFKRHDLIINIDLPDISNHETFRIEKQVKYEKERDYLKSSFNVLVKNGFTFSQGLECKIGGNIPINTGTSSSSALIVSWINFLARMSDQAIELPQNKIAEYAYKAEVLEFSEPGGMMDHYSTSLGKTIWLESYPKTRIEKFNVKLGAFILGNSKEPKDTTSILARVKLGVLNILSKLQKHYPEFLLSKINVDKIDCYKKHLSSEEYKMLVGTIKNRDITFSAKKIFQTNPLDNIMIGKLLNDHQKILRDDLQISTAKIDSMIDSALQAGALGAKINGSGGGGCMFAYAPDNTDMVLEAVKKISNDSYIVFSDEGTKEEK